MNSYTRKKKQRWLRRFFRSFCFEKEYLPGRILLLLSCVLGLTILFFSNRATSCFIPIVQGIIIPIIGTSLILPRLKLSDNQDGYRAGVSIGAILGMIPSVIFYTAECIEYFFLGGRISTYEARNSTIPPLSTMEILVFIYSFLFLFLAMSIISLLTAMSVTIIVLKRRKTGGTN